MCPEATTDDAPGPVPAPKPGPARRVLVGLAFALVALALLSFAAAHALTDALDELFELRRLAQAEMLGPPLVHMVLALQAALIAIPFVPGAEVGFLLLAICGAQLAVEVYAATVVGLLLAFGIGRAVPRRRAERLLARLRLDAAADAVARLTREGAAAPTEGGWPFRRLLGRLLRHRCLCLVLLINTPGNTLLGGGGGIALAAGMSRLFSLPQFLASALIAVAPVPAFVLLMAAFA